MKTIRHIMALVLMLVLPTMLSAQTVQLDAPSTVEAGNRFQVTYIINSAEANDPQLVGSFSGAISMLYGPNHSSSYSSTIINGKMTVSGETRLSFVCEAVEAGSGKIPGLKVTADGKQLSCSGHTIRVIGNGGGGNVAPQPQQPQQQTPRTLRERIGVDEPENDGKNIFVVASLSRERVFEQEATVLSYRLYTRFPRINTVGNKMPQLDNVHIQDITTRDRRVLEPTRYHGRTYYSTITNQYVLLPQRSGDIEIPSSEFTYVVNGGFDPFDPFGGDGDQLVVNSNAVHLQVDSLPAAPDDFCGLVGHDISVTANLKPQQVSANDGATLHMVVSGAGNLNLMLPPSVRWPDDFEGYDPKVDNRCDPSQSGVTGNVVFDYVAVPRQKGEYRIPAVTFSYFDTSSRSYRQLSTRALTLNVSESKGGGVSMDDSETFTDIRHIKVGDPRIHPVGDTLLGSAWYYLIYVLLLVIFGVVVAIFYRYVQHSADIIGRRGKKAGAEAAKRLRSANTLLQQHQAEPFYDEVMRALLGYICDKLNIPNTELNKDNVAESLRQRGVSDATIQRYITVLGDCEFARFAPGDASQKMGRIYAEATDAINAMENEICTKGSDPSVQK